MSSQVHPVSAAALLVRPRVASSAVLLCVLAACSNPYMPRADQHSSVYAGPSRYYPPPGPSDDPWGPYVREASARYGVPEQWIREVMRQESDGEEQAVSSAGAIGLMQIMPDTYDDLRQRHALGDDPFEPHNNIMGGAAYIRELYDRYGAPGFLAAYNAGPSRLDDYLGGGDPLPDETVNYVASIAPRLAASVRMTGPLAVYAEAENGTRSAAANIGQANAPLTMPSTAGEACDPDAAYDPDRPCPSTTTLADAPVAAAAYQGCSANTAYDSSRSCSRTAGNAAFGVPTAIASKSSLYQPMASVAPANVPAASMPRSSSSTAVISGIWAIQVGAFSSPIRARAAATGVHDTLADLLSTARIELLPTSPFGGQILYRAQLGNLSANAASAACARLEAEQQPCMIVAPGQESLK
jgi:D-alanyl-D-alanine carboxypeptidase